MSNPVDDLTDDIRSLGIAVVDGPPVDLAGPLAQHLHNLGYRKPAIIDRDDLECLEVGSVILDGEGVKIKSQWIDGNEQLWYLAGRGNMQTTYVTETATVLYEPVA